MTDPETVYAAIMAVMFLLWPRSVYADERDTTHKEMP